MIFSCQRSGFIVQDRIRFDSAICISGWVCIVHAEYFLSKTLIRGDIFNNNGLLYAMLIHCWIDEAILLLRIDAKSKLIIYSLEWVWIVHKEYSDVYALSQVHFDCYILLPMLSMLCSSERIDILSWVEAIIIWIEFPWSFILSSSFSCLFSKLPSSPYTSHL